MSRGGDNSPAWHVCDERGRTVAVYEHGVKVWDPEHRRETWELPRDRAERHAAHLTQQGATTFLGRDRHFAVLSVLRPGDPEA